MSGYRHKQKRCKTCNQDVVQSFASLGARNLFFYFAEFLQLAGFAAFACFDFFALFTVFVECHVRDV